jgi:hypothetical protein
MDRKEGGDGPTRPAQTNGWSEYGSPVPQAAGPGTSRPPIKCLKLANPFVVETIPLKQTHPESLRIWCVLQLPDHAEILTLGILQFGGHVPI